jgi:subtilisin-like proprotein convertase family protein
MKKIYTFLLPIVLIFYSISSYSQVFTNTTRTSIPDASVAIYVPITVSGLPSLINSTFGLKKICINLRHTYIGDLRVELLAPTGGDSMKISDRNGGGNDITTNLCFHETAPNFIVNYPILGATDYYGVESINVVNTGRNPNGTWYLVIQDLAGADTGYVDAISLEFGASPPPTHTRIITPPPPPGAYICSETYPFLCVCPDLNDTCILLPDMTTSANAIRSAYYEEPGKLFFAIATPNIGYGPLEIHAIDTACYCDTLKVLCNTPCPLGITKLREVYQTTYQRNDSIMVKNNIPMGLMTYDSTSKIIFDKWTHNTLRLKTNDPNPLNWIILSDYSHNSNCLVNTNTCSNRIGYCVDTLFDTIINTDLPNYGFGSVTGCGMNQGIYVGNMEKKDAGYIGQQVDLPYECNGEYYIVSIVDPENRIKETNENNNWTLVKLNLTNQASTCCHADFYADTLVGMNSLTVQFSDSTIPNAHHWTWDFGDGTTDTTQFPLHVYNTPGNYTVKLYTSSNNGCTDTMVKTDFITINTISSIYSLESISQVSVYPNPFVDQLIINYTVPTSIESTIQIIDLMGKEIYHTSKYVDSQRPLVLNNTDLKLISGTYFIKISYGENSKTFKVVKL